MSLESVKNIVLILSGKGGVGKSSVTTQLALSLSLRGKSVGILDIDLTGPSIPRFLGLEDAKIKQAPGGWLPVEVHKAQVLPPIPISSTPERSSVGADPSASGVDDSDTDSRRQDIHSTATTGATTNGGTLPPFAPHLSSDPVPDHSSHTPNPPQTESDAPIGALHAISLAFLLPTRSSAVIWRGPKKTAMVRQFLTDVLWPPSGIDYLLIDTPPGTSDEHIALAETLLSATSNSTTTTNNTTNPNPNHKASQPRLAGALIVTTPQAVAVSDVRKEMNFCRKTGIDVLGVVENMAGFVCECCGEQTDLFGRGGGELMAKEFGVRFLGRVALDTAWGRLVEEGRRPRYGTEDEVEEGEGGEKEEEEAAVMVNGEDGGGAGRDDEQHDGRKPPRREEGLLVDKYRSCKLCETFQGIARQLVGIVEEGSQAG